MSEGNALEMAVAFVLGAAFTMLVTSLTDNLIQPMVGLLLGGRVDAGTITIDGQTIDFTAMINAAITFLITAVVIYVVFVHPMNAIRERRHRGEAPKLNSEDYLREIRDLLAAQSQGARPIGLARRTRTAGALGQTRVETRQPGAQGPTLRVEGWWGWRVWVRPAGVVQRQAVLRIWAGCRRRS